jgi:hypothetical protein
VTHQSELYGNLTGRVQQATKKQKMSTCASLRSKKSTDPLDAVLYCLRFRACGRLGQGARRQAFTIKLRCIGHPNTAKRSALAVGNFFGASLYTTEGQCWEVLTANHRVSLPCVLDTSWFERDLHEGEHQSSNLTCLAGRGRCSSLEENPSCLLNS